MKLNETQFKEKVASLYKGEIIIIGKYKSLNFPVLCLDKYGIMKVKWAGYLLRYRPTIKMALNKTLYFMNELLLKYPGTYKLISPLSEYISAKDKMLFNTRYGIVSISPDSLLHGHIPTVRSAIDRKQYMKNQLLFIYDNKYDFDLISTNRHAGRIDLICNIHGRQSIDSDTIFLGCGCPKCNKGWENSNIFYLIHLYDDNESFYKIGISYKLKNGDIRRFREYKRLKYNVEVIYTHSFEDALSCKEFETELKQIIKPCLYVPKRWEYSSSTETFTNELLPIIKQNLI